MPGPWSSKVSFNPVRVPLLTTSMRQLPPPPCPTALRPSSLDAVIILVWSTRLNFSSVVQARTFWRRLTTSLGSLSATDSDLRVVIGFHAVAVYQFTQHFHAGFDVERCLYPGHGH